MEVHRRPIRSRRPTRMNVGREPTAERVIAGMPRYDFSRLAIMIVDDNRMMRTLLEQLLHSFGVGHIIRAANGEDALHILNREFVDIIITDWMMAPLDGLDLVRGIRTGKNSPNRLVPVLMITGLSEMWRVAAARDVGVNGFVVKPLTGEALLSRIVHIVENPRFFVHTRTYLGPDRRRGTKTPYDGPERRTIRSGHGEAMRRTGRAEPSDHDPHARTSEPAATHRSPHGPLR